MHYPDSGGAWHGITRYWYLLDEILRAIDPRRSTSHILGGVQRFIGPVQQIVLVPNFRAL
jgi:hypothetical protein